MWHADWLFCWENTINFPWDFENASSWREEHNSVWRHHQADTKKRFIWSNLANTGLLPSFSVPYQARTPWREDSSWQAKNTRWKCLPVSSGNAETIPTGRAKILLTLVGSPSPNILILLHWLRWNTYVVPLVRTTSFLDRCSLSKMKAGTHFMENGFPVIFGVHSPNGWKVNMWVTTAVRFARHGLTNHHYTLIPLNRHGWQVSG